MRNFFARTFNVIEVCERNVSEASVLPDLTTKSAKDFDKTLAQ